jgi:isoleucyl-tRNA synthetase
MIKKYGADLVRLWVASSDYKVDVRVSDQIFKQLSEAYRKIRNTARILLANLSDFNPDTDMVATCDMQQIDKWLIAGLEDLVREAREAYDNYEFHVVYHAITNFCTVDLSKLYVDITKDRVYVEKKDSVARRSAQTAMYIALDAITKLVAPLIAFTAEEIWQAMPHAASDNKASVYLNEFPNTDFGYDFGSVRDEWNALFALRDDVMKALEIARASKLIGKSLDAKVVIYTTDKDALATLEKFSADLATVFITSGAEVISGEAPEGAFTETDSGIAVVVAAADGHRCDRCWSYSSEGEMSDEGFICARCKAIVDSL